MYRELRLESLFLVAEPLSGANNNPRIAPVPTPIKVATTILFALIVRVPFCLTISSFELVNYPCRIYLDSGYGDIRGKTIAQRVERVINPSWGENGSGVSRIGRKKRG
jgi:hypothetical protein